MVLYLYRLLSEYQQYGQYVFRNVYDDNFDLQHKQKETRRTSGMNIDVLDVTETVLKDSSNMFGCLKRPV